MLGNPWLYPARMLSSRVFLDCYYYGYPCTSDRIEGKVCAVTGVSSGLGRAIALAFTTNGAYPIICLDLRTSPRETFGIAESEAPTHELVCKRYGEGKAAFVKVDVTKATEVEHVVKEVVRLGGRLDVSSCSDS